MNDSTRSDNNKTNGAKGSGDLFDQHGIQSDSQPTEGGDLFDSHGVNYEAPVEEPIPSPNTPEESYTLGERASDTGKAFAHGANNVAKSGFQIWGMTGGLVNKALAGATRGLGLDAAADQFDQNAEFFDTNQHKNLTLQKVFEENDEIYRNSKSEDIQERKAELDQEVAEAENEWQKGYARFKGTLTDPALAGDFIATQLPQLIALGGIGRAVTAAAGAKAGTAATIATGGAMQAGSVGDETSTAVTEELGKVARMTPEELDDHIVAHPELQALIDRKIDLKNQGLSDEQVDGTIARELSQKAALSSFAISLLVSRLPFASQLEKSLAGAGSAAKSKVGLAARVVGGALGEGVSEAIEEGSGQALQNLAVREVDPTQELSEGVGSAAGEGAASVVFGGIGGALGGSSQAESTAENAAPEAKAKPDLLDEAGIDPSQEPETQEAPKPLAEKTIEDRPVSRETVSDPDYTGEEKRTDISRRERIASMSEEEIESELYRNDLTGSLNRRAFNEDIGDAKQVVSVDIDALASTNDYGSMDAGDTLLSNAAKAFDEVFGSSAYHISGDEFYVLDGAATQPEVEAKLKEVRKIMSSQKIETTKDGKKVVIDGANFTYGIGTDKDSADSDMKSAKVTRTEQGKRTARKELPPNMKYFDAKGNELTATLDESGGLLLAGNEGIIPNNESTGEANERRQDEGVRRVPSSHEQQEDGSTGEGRDSQDVLERGMHDKRVKQNSKREQPGQQPRSKSGKELSVKSSDSELDNEAVAEESSRTEPDGIGGRKRKLQSEEGEVLSDGGIDLKSVSSKARAKRVERIKANAPKGKLGDKIEAAIAKSNSAEDFQNFARGSFTPGEVKELTSKGGFNSLFEAFKVADKPKTNTKPKANTEKQERAAFDKAVARANKLNSSHESQSFYKEYSLSFRTEEYFDKARDIRDYAGKNNKPHIKKAQSISDDMWTAAGFDVKNAPLVTSYDNMKEAYIAKGVRIPIGADANLQYYDPLAHSIVIGPEFEDGFKSNSTWEAALAHESLAHEMGHAIHVSKWAETPLSVKADVINEWSDWREQVATARDSEGRPTSAMLEAKLPSYITFISSRIYGGVFGVKAADGQISNRVIEGATITPSLEKGNSLYYSSFNEWFADESARYTLYQINNDPDSVSAKYGKELRSLFSKAYKSMRSYMAKILNDSESHVLDKIDWQKPSKAVVAFAEYHRDKSAIQQTKDYAVEKHNANYLTVDENGNVPLVHFSDNDFTSTDPQKFGSNPSVRGTERARYNEDNFTPGTYFGIPGYKKERGLGSKTYTAEIPASKLYDWRGDPEGIVKDAVRWDKYAKMYKRDVNLAEKRVKQAGYKGYFSDQFKYAVVFESLKVTPANAIRGTFNPMSNDEPKREDAIPEGMNVTEFILQKQKSPAFAKRTKTDGRYVGAPKRVGNSKSALQTLRKKLDKLTEEGMVGRFWYEDSSKAILKMASGNREEAEKIAALFAIYSANATVKSNTAKVMNAYYQFKATGKIEGASFGVHDAKAMDVMNGKLHTGEMKAATVTGIKRNSFYQNLMVHIDRSKLDPTQATMDMWMAIAGGYDSNQLDQGPKYNFMNNEVHRIAVRKGIEPWQVQAAIWVAMKARWTSVEQKAVEGELKKGIRKLKEGVDKKDPKAWKKTEIVDLAAHYEFAHDVAMRSEPPSSEQLVESKYDFADALAERNAYILSERGDPDFFKEVQRVLVKDGGNRIAKAIGMATPESEVGYSSYDSERGLGEISLLPVAYKSERLESEDGSKFTGRNLTQSAKKMLRTYAIAKAYVMNDPAVTWYFPVYDETKSRNNGTSVSFSRPLTDSEIELVDQALKNEINDSGVNVVKTATGVDVMRFERKSKLSNIDFQKAVSSALGKIDIDASARVTPFRSVGETITNNWNEDTKGESYLEQLGGKKRSALREELANIKADIDKAAEGFNGLKGTEIQALGLPKKPKGFSGVRGSLEIIRNRARASRLRLRTQLKRQFTTRGLLDLGPAVDSAVFDTMDNPFELKNKADGMKAVSEKNVEFYLQRLRNAMRDGYGTGKLKPIHFEQVNEYLAGGDGTNVPRKTRAVVDEIRNYIDTLSDGVMETIVDRIVLAENKMTPETRAEYELALETNGDKGKIPVDLQKHLAMLNTIESKKGEYLHRSYAAFDDPKWIDHVKANRKDLIKNAEDFLREENPDWQESEVKGAVETMLQDAASTSDITGFMTRGSKYGSKDQSVLRKRNEGFPIELRELLGEYKDARVNIAKTSSKLSYLYANHKFLMNLHDTGMGVFLFDNHHKFDESRNFTKRIASKTNDSMNPLNGLYTTPEFDQGLQDLMEVSKAGGIMRAMVATNSAVKYGKTIISPATQIANFASGLFFSIANGHILSMSGLAATKKAGSVSVADLAGENSIGKFFGKRFDKNWSAEKYRDYINDLIERGVLHNSPNATEMRKAIEDFMEFKTTVEGPAHPRKWLQFMQKTYQLGDDFWKIIGYESEKHSKLKAGFEPEVAERYAADRIVNGYPTYSMVPRLVQQIRKWWLVGTFVSFPYEMLRTTANQYRFLNEDRKIDKPAAARRALGLIAAHSAFTALAMWSMNEFGIDDEEDEVVKSFLPKWSRNSTLLYTGYDEHGMPTYIDLTRWNPYAYVQNPIRAFANGNNKSVLDKFLDATKELSDPFIGPEITANALVEVYANKKIEQWGSVYNEQDSGWEQFKDKFNHLRRNMQPTIFSQLENVARATRGETRGSKQMKVSDELKAMLSVRSNTLNVQAALKYKAFAFKGEKSAATTILSRTVNKTYDVSHKELKSAFTRMQNARGRIYKRMIEYVNGARALGATDKEIRNLLRSKRVAVGVADTDYIMRGEIPEWKPSKNFVKIDLDPSNKALDQSQLKEWRKEREQLIKQWLRERRNEQTTN